MRCLRYALLVLFSLGGVASVAHATAESPVVASQRAAKETQQILLDEIRRLKTEASGQGLSSTVNGLVSFADNRDDCQNQPGPPQTCARNCQVRFSNGDCGSYAPDFCGPRANCAPNCQVRFSNGECGSYGPDFCGPRANCSPNCQVRFSNGDCGSYGPDVCF